MRAVLMRLRPRTRVALLKLAGWVGTCVRSVPGAAGALLIAYGAWQVYAPAGPIVAGLFLLAVDRTVP